MTRKAALLAAAVCLGALGGCVDRRIVITTAPPDAVVYLNDVEVGRTPLEVDFTYFGHYDVRIHREGFEPLVTSREAKAPMHEWPGIDLIAMAVPVRKRTIIRWHFDLEPEAANRDALLGRASELSELLESPSAAEEAE